MASIVCDINVKPPKEYKIDIADNGDIILQSETVRIVMPEHIAQSVSSIIFGILDARKKKYLYR
jgi:hypothetical protein